MNALQQRIEGLTILIDELHELARLREQVRKAQLSASRSMQCNVQPRAREHLELVSGKANLQR